MNPTVIHTVKRDITTFLAVVAVTVMITLIYPCHTFSQENNPDLPDTEITFDHETGEYLVTTRVGNIVVSTPFRLTGTEFQRFSTRKSFRDYYARRNSEHLNPITSPRRPKVLAARTVTNPLEKIFGPGGVSIRTQGNAGITAGIKSTHSDNPALGLTSRRHTYFDFTQKIQANVQAAVGTRLKFNMNYNTEATFNFDSKNLKLKYDGTEDDIIKELEAGNVSLTTGSSLIRGSTALFGVRSKMQLGRLTATAVVAQQNSETRSISTRRGVQTEAFRIRADEYDANRHFFLAQYFREGYDRFASKLPLVSSGIQITRIEVWVTNHQSDYNQSRNIVAFADIGESRFLANKFWKISGDPTSFSSLPSNQSNRLLETMKTDYPDVRYINSVTQALEPLATMGFVGGEEYEKVESARLLDESEYTLNPTLGYISLRSQLRSDQVLGVAFEYTYQGKVYQVGEFSGDITSTGQNLYVKMLKSTTQTPTRPMWRLMMKNVYDLGATQIQNKNFRLQIKYLSDTTGTEINYLPIPGLSDKPLLRIMNLDRLDSNLESNPDGFFDFIEGYTINSTTGRIFFTVAEPFGSHLAGTIGNDKIADNYIYRELYDSTLVVARQYADKNKFIITGEYEGSNGAQIRMNAFNVPRGSVIVMAGGVRLTENSDYTVDYASGIVTILNRSIIESGQNISVTLEDQSLFSTQRKSLLGLDLNYAMSDRLSLGATLLHYGEKALTEKVNIGEETVNNTMLGVNFAYDTELMWLTNLLSKIPTVNSTAPSRLSLRGEAAVLLPQKQGSGTNKGSSYIDDFENAQSRFDLRSPYAWSLSSTPYEQGPQALFPEAALSNNTDYGKNRALLNWYYIDRLFTSKNSSLVPGYIKSDLKQLSNPYVREVTSKEIFPKRELTYGESSLIQTLNLSFYPDERGPYNLDATNIDNSGKLLMPEKRWGGIMRKIENPNFEQQNIEYIQFWLMNPFLDPENPNYEGGDLYLNLGEISEDILKDGLKSYENGVPYDGDDQYMRSTVWGRVSSQNSLNYAFDNASGARKIQDTGLDGLLNADEFVFNSYKEYIDRLKAKLSPSAVEEMQRDRFSPFNDPAGDNYHFYRGSDYDEERLGILQRYKRYNGVEGNSLSPEDAGEKFYQSNRNTPDAEDINQDNTLNEYERYFQYRISIRPEDLTVGRNYITDKQTSIVYTRDGNAQEVEWYQFKISLADFEKSIGGISDFSTIRFMRIFLTGFKKVTHLRFATLELVRGEWRPYMFSLNGPGETPTEGELDISVVNIEENAGREPVNYLLPPGVSRQSDPSQAQIIQENEQSMQMKITGLDEENARGVFRSTQLDLRNYERLQMWIHAESLTDNLTDLMNDELTAFIRLGSDVKQNYYEYEIPLVLTPHGKYTDTPANREMVWPAENRLDVSLKTLVGLKTERNRLKRAGEGASFNEVFYGVDPEHPRNTVAVLGNPSISDIRVMLIGIRNKSHVKKSGIVWVNELRATDFDTDGGYALKGEANLMLSDIATLNFGTHIESAGFGGVDQGLNERRMDDLRQYHFAVQGDAGKLLPQGAYLHAPVFYGYTSDSSTPKFDPTDRDVKLSEALEAAPDKSSRDSIKAYATDRTIIRNLSISALNFGIRSETPKPWDPANFTAGFSYSKQTRKNPTIEYEYTNDYRGMFQYNYSPYPLNFRPFRGNGHTGRYAKFLREWEVNLLPSLLGFSSNISRFYYEQQTRSEVDQHFKLPISISKNFLWDRQFHLSWNITRSLNLDFTTNTAARIEEPAGAVNKKLFPDEYREWRDTVIKSILSLGTPWNYSQTATATYNAPFNRIPCLDFLNATLGYSSVYQWVRGATIEGVKIGHSISNQTSYTLDGRINLETLFNKWDYLKKINTRFGRKNQTRLQKRKPRRFEKNVDLSPDSATILHHGLNRRKLRIKAINLETGASLPLRTEIINQNSFRILNTGPETLQITVTEEMSSDRAGWEDALEYVLRGLMSPRNATVRIRQTHSLSIPLYGPEIGNFFGQTSAYGSMAPGLGFAFGFYDENFVGMAKERGWLITDNGQVSTSNFNRTSEIHFELALEPIRGLKIQFTANRTDNRTTQTQFMFGDMPQSIGGSYMKTHIALGSALRRSRAINGYESSSFTSMLENISIITERIERHYQDLNYPSTGFIIGTALAGQPYNSSLGSVSPSSSDVLIPAFLAAYSGGNPNSQYLSPFPALSAVLPNWRITYDGLSQIDIFRERVKAITLTHSYQCTYTAGNYGSYMNWVKADGDLGFIRDELTGNPIPSGRYNVASVAITERFAPLVGIAVTLRNNLTLNAEWRDQRNLTLNCSAGQIVEAMQQGIAFGLGYRITGFDTVLRIKGQQKGISHDLQLNGDISFSETQALIRRIETAYTQATSGNRTLNVNLKANYQMSRRLQIGAYLEHQTNIPIVSSNSYPMSSTAFGLNFNINLAR